MKINTALILCAGFGKRLKHLTTEKPKPLLEVNNITLLENTINLVEKLNIFNVKINSFYLKDQVKNFISKKKFKLNIEIIDDGNTILETKKVTLFKGAKQMTDIKNGRSFSFSYSN